MTKEEWQDPDSGYLNCIGVGDSYVKRQLERILGKSCLKVKDVYYDTARGVEVIFNNPRFTPKETFMKEE